MYFTRQTEIAISILTLCARQSGSYITAHAVAGEISASTESVERTMAMLLRGGLLRSPRQECGVQLAVDPESVSLGALLHITQPSLLRPTRAKKRAKPPVTVFNLVVEAASSNFLRLAERYTVADFLDGRALSGRYAARGRNPALQAVPAPRQQDCRGN
jgi:DNA-binding IscR family transcriptional regulator